MENGLSLYSGVVLDLEHNRPIIKMNSENDYMHFFKKGDHGNIKALFNYCRDNKFDVYLSGGAVVSKIMTNKVNYNDIDMLAVAETQNMYNFAKLLTKCSPLKVQSLEDLSKVKGRNVFDANGKLFQTVAASTAEKYYMSAQVDERFILMPLTPISNINDGFNTYPSAIDLSLMTDELFKSIYKPKTLFNFPLHL
jgi:hypothetical protein